MQENENNNTGRATVRAFLVGIVLSGVFAWYTVMRDNREPIQLLSAHMITVLPFMMLFLSAFLVNPILKRLRLGPIHLLRPFSISEMLLVFLMCAVGAGTASYGLSGRLVPLVTSVSNPKINTPQSKMDVNVLPFLNEDYFILEEGVHDAAVRVREAHLAYMDAQRQYRTANDLLLGRSDLDRLQAERLELSQIEDEALRAPLIRKLDFSLARTTRLIDLATESWDEIGQGQELTAVVETYPAKLDDLRQQRETLREALRERNQASFAAVERIRNGLPKGARAIPGFLYIPGEGMISYIARNQRMRKGGAALERLDALLGTLDDNASSPSPEQLNKRIESIIQDLTPITTAPGLDSYRKKLEGNLEKLESELTAKKTQVQAVRSERRFADFEDTAELDKQLATLVEPLESIEEKIKDQQDMINRRIKPVLDSCALVTATQEHFRSLALRTDNLSADELREGLLTVREAFVTFDATSRRYWVGDGDWEVWIKPIMNWLLLIFLGYLVFMTFNTLVYRQWSHNEKLLYPIAEITTLLATGNSDHAGRAPPAYKTGLFWFGFAVAMGVLGWNHLAGLQLVSNLGKISLATEFSTYTGQTFRGMQGGYFLIVFMVIGISFLLPANISFSFWGFQVFAMALYVVMVWLGYGGSLWSKGSMMRSISLGCGGMLVFGSVIIWTCRKYLLCAFKPNAVKDLAPDERKEMRIASFLFLAGSLALTLILTIRFDVSIFYTILYLVLVLFITVVTVRMVAEGGIIGLHSGFTAIELWTKILGTTKAWTAPMLFAPLIIFNTLLLGTLKGFVAPAMANAIKVREKMRIRRLAFHGAVTVGILVAVLVSIITLIILSYDVGANSLNKSMHEAQITTPGIANIIDNPPGNDAVHTRWIVGGVLAMVFLLVARRSIFWIPHPIGFVALMNPRMMNFWGSILIGWMLKNLVSKYGDEKQYLRLRCFFIGLVVGHLLACLLGWDQLEWLRPYHVL